MADGQTFDAVGELQQRYPAIASEPREKAQAYLSEPQNFRSAFPEYAHLDDDTIRRNMAAPKAQPSFLQRLKSVAGWEPEKPDTSHMEGHGSDEAGPYARLPQQMNAAQTAAGFVAGMGEGSMGMPRPNIPGLVRDAASVGSEAASKIASGLKNVRFRPQEPAPPTPAPSAVALRAARTALSGTSTASESVAALPKEALPGIAKGAMSSTGALPKEALPGIAKGVTSSTGATPNFQIGKPPAEPVDPVAAAIKQGIAAKLPTRMPAPKAAAIAKGLGDISPAANEPNFTGSEGRPATWTNERVTQLMRTGNRDAITQGIRRGLEMPPNTKYIMGDADYPRAVLNPRETTKFTPEGTPIRNADNPIAQNPSSRAHIQPGEMPAARVEAPTPAAPRAPSPENLQTAMRAAREAQAPAIGTPVTPRAPRAGAVPVTQRYAPDIIEQAENEMRGALELGDTMPQAGRYFSENTYEEHPLAGRYDVKAGERPGGTWSGISSQKGNIAGQYPWFNDPEISVSKLRNAIQQGKGALYERIVGKIADGITKERGAATAAISEQIPQLRELAGQVQEVEPELAQALNDLADGKIGLAPDKLRAYVTEKISDATAAKQFAQAIDDAAAEPRSPGVSETHANVAPARPGSGEAGTAAQAPELKPQTLGSIVQRKQ